MDQLKQNKTALPFYINDNFDKLPKKGKSRNSVKAVFQQIVRCFSHQLTLEENNSPVYPTDTDNLELAQNNVSNKSDDAISCRVVDQMFYTEYTIVLKEREYPVIGTYVDEKITPGFYYRVRRISTDTYLWDGHARCLLSIGMGYGKRITFKSDNLLNASDHYMYSDTEAEGFAFSPAVPACAADQKLIMCDCNGREVGTVTLLSVCPTNQRVLSPPAVNSNGDLEGRISCEFTCNIHVTSYPGGVVPLESSQVNCELKGVASVVKRGGAENLARLERISQISLPFYSGVYSISVSGE